MESKIDKFSIIMKKILSEENRDVLLGDISEEIEESIATIKDMIDSNEITYEQMKEELSKNLNVNTLHRPGSVAQMMIGCTSEESCPMKQEELLDIPFFYDTHENSLIPITRDNSPISINSYAVVYITGNYSDLDKEIFKKLNSKGFKKVKIMHKKETRSRYNITTINDISEKINQSEKNIFKNLDMMLYLIITVVLVLLISLLIRYVKK